MVCTCGDECGYTDRILRKKLAHKGIALTGAYSLIMSARSLISLPMLQRITHG